MVSLGRLPPTARLAIILGAAAITGIDARQLDGALRAGEGRRAYVTAPATLGARDAGKVCGTGLYMCPSSASGGCCPVNYSCGVDSCYETSRAPSTCGTRVGWQACDPVHGGGCCPEGWECDTGNRCLPPPGAPYTFSCPTSHYLCPPSADYGCCPNGMACGKQQCYSTEATTITSVVEVTTTRDGEETTITSTSVTVKSPIQPTPVATVDRDQEGDQVVYKYVPSRVGKASPTADPKGDEANSKGSDSGGLSKAQLGGIVAGAVILLVITVLVAFFILRKPNGAATALDKSSVTNHSAEAESRPPIRQFHSTDSGVDALSVDPLMRHPQPSYTRQDSCDAHHQLEQTGSEPSSTKPTLDSVTGGSQQATPGNSRHTSVDAAGNVMDYFDPVADRSARASQGSGTTAPYYRVSADSQQMRGSMHGRNWSRGSDRSEEGSNNARAHGTGVTELEATPYVPELMGSPTTMAVVDERRTSSGSGTGATAMTRPPSSHQRKKSESRSISRADGTPPAMMLGVVSEEMHGFHGPTDRMAGQTAHRPPTRDAGTELGHGDAFQIETE